MAGPEPAACAEFDRLCGEAVESGQSLGWFRKKLRDIATRGGWTAWGEGRDFDRRALVVYRFGGTEDCSDDHRALDGLVVPSEHEFWDIWAPPNSYVCSCYVLGASSERAASRLEDYIPRT